MKKLILLLLFVMLVFSCQSIVDNIIELTTGYSSDRIQYNYVFREQMTSDGDPCDRSQESGFVQEKFCTSCGSSGKYVIIDGFSARGMSEKVFVERCVERMETITELGRKRFYGLIVVSHDPSAVSKRITNLANTKIVFRSLRLPFKGN